MSFLKVYSSTNNETVYQTPTAINPSKVVYTGDDFLYYTEKYLDYNWDRGLLISYFKNKKGLNRYELQAKYVNAHIDIQ